MATPADYYKSLPPVSKVYGVACLLTTTADYLQLYSPSNIALSYELVFKRFQVMAVVPYLLSEFMGASLVFMIVYVWGREFPNAQINFYGLVSFKGFYLPWIYLALDLLLGNPLKPDILGMVAGHLYYFLTVLHPLAGGKNILKTPLWVHKLVALWGKGTQVNSPVQQDPNAGVAFRGRSYRLNGNQRRSPSEAETSTPMQQTDPNSGVPFQGKSYRLGGH